MSKKQPETFFQKNYDWHAAGKIWTFDRVKFTKAPDGEIGISFEELDRMNRLIANEICRNTNSMLASELDFFCETTSTNYVEVAKFLHVSKATVSQWIRKKATLSFAESVLLKELFWDKVFGKDLSAAKRNARAVMPHDKLSSMGRYAEEHEIVKGTVRPKVA